jgi:hypothetical protein
MCTIADNDTPAIHSRYRRGHAIISKTVATCNVNGYAKTDHGSSGTWTGGAGPQEGGGDEGGWHRLGVSSVVWHIPR